MCRASPPAFSQAKLALAQYQHDGCVLYQRNAAQSKPPTQFGKHLNNFIPPLCCVFVSKTFNKSTRTSSFIWGLATSVNGSAHDDDHVVGSR